MMFKNVKMTEGQEKLWNVLVFLIRLIILSIPLYLILMFSVNLSPLQHAVAGQSAAFLEFLGHDVVLDGYHITVGTQPNDFYFYINEDCTGWKSMLFLFALMFAVPGISIKRRLIGLAIGIPVIWVGNLFRVVGVVLAERAYGVEFALNIHDFGYRIGLIVLVLVIWTVWLKLSREKKKNIWDKLSDLFHLRL